MPAVVQDFLYGPWALVMAHARLTDTQRQIDPGGWSSVITDLLWSVKREQTLRNPAKLIATIPKMLERLRGGPPVGQDPQDNGTFFTALEKLHRPVLKLRAKQRHASDSMPAELEVDPALMATERQQPKRDRGEPWMAREELDAAGFLDTMPSAPAPLADESPQASDAEADTVQAAEEAPLDEGDVAVLVGGLHQGQLGRPVFAQGVAPRQPHRVSGRATLFMFVSSGGRPHSMTRRSLERLVRDRLLRPVDAGDVVPRALEQLSRRRERPRALAA
ncbi:DUF1631 family protein [Ramlibacter terrae]|uniref:DUF1631 family protein n=1 Tax=Ramlibacter terrae TaxID=2732511 RepID=A0ABX6P073_9BURK|nr:DUF1631 family protein [Ramlibacter terrae]